MVTEHQKDRYEVPDHWQSQARDKLFKVEVWRHPPIVNCTRDIADDENTENNSDPLNTLTQIVAPLSNLSERMK